MLVGERGSCNDTVNTSGQGQVAAVLRATTFHQCSLGLISGLDIHVQSCQIQVEFVG